MKNTERNLRRKAHKIGYTLSKGFQKYIAQDWSFLRDENGDKLVGFSIFNPEGISVNAPYESVTCHDHEMSIDEVESYLKNHYEQQGLKW